MENKTNNAMKWSAKNYKSWNKIKGILTDTEDIGDAINLIKTLYQDSLYDLAFLIIQALNVTVSGEQVLYQMITDVCNEKWGNSAQKEFIKRYIKLVESKVDDPIK